MRVALAQFLASQDKSANAAAIAQYLRLSAAEGAELVVFPEASMVSTRGGPGEVSVASEPLSGSFVSQIQSVAAEVGVSTVVGIFERGKDSSVYNTLVAVGASGELVGTYRKTYLYRAFGYDEQDYVSPGTGDALVFEVAGIHFGVLTCYDIRFAELSAMLVRGGAQVIIVSAAWARGLLKEGHWEILLRARAIENTVYVLASNQVGGPYTGASMVVDPLGIVRSRAGEEAELLLSTVDPSRLAEARSKLPVLGQRRVDRGPLVGQETFAGGSVETGPESSAARETAAGVDAG